jgi:hypothetical protein
MEKTKTDHRPPHECRRGISYVEKKMIFLKIFQNSLRRLASVPCFIFSDWNVGHLIKFTFAADLIVNVEKRALKVGEQIEGNHTAWHPHVLPLQFLILSLSAIGFCFLPDCLFRCFARLSANFSQCYKTDDQGLMFLSRFSAIFDNFSAKNGVFLKNQCYIWSNICTI